MLLISVGMLLISVSMLLISIFNSNPEFTLIKIFIAYFETKNF
jgi:hypothetical protein